MPRAVSERSADAAVRAAPSELAKASEFAALPRRRDERVYAYEREARLATDP